MIYSVPYMAFLLAFMAMEVHYRAVLRRDRLTVDLEAQDQNKADNVSEVGDLKGEVAENREPYHGTKRYLSGA